RAADGAVAPAYGATGASEGAREPDGGWRMTSSHRKSDENDRRETARRALRATQAPAYDRPLERLAARIARAAAPALAGGRGGLAMTLGRDAWEYAAGWARALIPLGASVGVASIAMLWVITPVERATAAPVVVAAGPMLLGVEPGHGDSTAMLNHAIDVLVEPG